MNLYYDIRASFVVFFISIPLCIGIAIASKAPVQSGIISGIIGGIIVGILSGSARNISGPSISMIAINIVAIETLKDYKIFLCAVIIAGVFQIFIGLSRIAKFGRYIPSSIINGLLFGFGFIIVFNEIPELFGYSSIPTGDFAFFKNYHQNNHSMKTFLDIINRFDIGCTIVSISSIILYFFLIKIEKSTKYKTIPKYLFIIIFAIILSFLFKEIRYLFPFLPLNSNQLVQMPIINNSIFDQLKAIMIFPNISEIINLQVIYYGVIMAFASSIESISSTEATDKLDPYKRHTSLSKEVLVQGIGNIVCGFIGGIPLSTTILRTSVNINAKANTNKSSIFSGIFLLVSIIFIPQIMNLIPISVLSTILIISGIKLMYTVDIKKIYNRGIDSYLPFCLTFIGIFFSNIIGGIIFGLCAGIFFILRNEHKNPFNSIKEKYSVNKAIRIKLPAYVSFLNKIAFSDLIKSIPEKSTVIIDAEDSQYIDPDVLDEINDFSKYYAPLYKINVTLNGFMEKYNVKNSPFITSITKEQQSSMTPDQVLEWILDGNNRFINNENIYYSFSKQRECTSKKQYPMVVILSCIDSRAIPEMIFDLGIGDAISVRIAGNIVNEDIISSIEFACSELKTKLIVVLGHTKCGAITAACKNYNHLESSGKKIIAHIRPLFDKVKELFSEKEICEEVIKMNVINSRNIISNDNIIKKMLDSKQIKIVSAVYDITTGIVTVID